MLTPFPGTPVAEELKITAPFRKYDVLHAVTPTLLPYSEFQRTFVRMSQAVFMSRATIKLILKLIKRHLLSKSGVTVLGRLYHFIRTLRQQIEE